MIVIPVVMPVAVAAVVLVTGILVRMRVRVAVVLVRVRVLVSAGVGVWVRHGVFLSLSDRLRRPARSLGTVDRHVGLVVMYHVAYYASPHVSQAQPEDRL